MLLVVVLNVQNTLVNFIGLSDLLRNKKAVARPQDLRDLENLPPVRES